MKAVAVAVLVLFISPVVRAWGGDGHQLTCLIAEDRLTPAAKKGIHELLGDDVNISDAEVASWADTIKRAHRNQGPWHYVDIPVDAKSYDAKRDGQNGDNIIDKINEYATVLADTTKPKQDREVALRFLVHLVGDIHQPLHCAERNNDAGGNKVNVLFLNRTKPVNLHTCWDSLILIAHKGKTRSASYADALNAKITSKQAADWSKGAPVTWANESHALAVNVVYHDVPESKEPAKMEQADVDRYGAVIDQQLQRGGVRLAELLNRALR
jgi:hypothetical protein